MFRLVLSFFGLYRIGVSGTKFTNRRDGIEVPESAKMLNISYIVFSNVRNI
mgnify:CR=1 FL=1